MNRVFLCAALLAASPVLFAQEESAAAEQQMPNPKQAQHEALKALAGTWDCIYRSEAMPGVPGMEEPTESKGVEHVELLCGGLWSKSTVRSTWQGQPFEAIFVVGYDPFQEQYIGLWAGSMDEEPGVSEWDGSYDEETKTWTWSGTTPHGAMRSTTVFTDADHTVETCYMTDPDGNEVKCAVVERARTKSGAPTDASASAATEPSKEQAVLLPDVGNWNAVVETTMAPGAKPTKEKATERVTAICNGRWVWSDFSGTAGGMPFTGHALSGYDPNAEKYVSYWIDSMSPVWLHTSGDYDAESSTFTLNGSGKDPTGKAMRMSEKITRKDHDHRVLEMTFAGEGYEYGMKIHYTRTKD